MLKGFPEAFEPLIERDFTVVFNEGFYPMSAEQLVEFIGSSPAAIIGIDRASRLVFEQCKGLKILSRNGVGFDNVDLRAALLHDVKVAIPVGANSLSVAELTISLIISLVRDIVNRHSELQSGIFRRVVGSEIAGKTLGIIGLGQVGKRVACRAIGMEMKVIANDIRPDHAFAQQYGIPFQSFDQVVAQADILSLHVPLTPLTLNMINHDSIQRMKAGSYLINTARAAVVDPYALVEALDKRHLSGAAIDVHFEELGSSAGLHEVFVGRKDVLTTPHIGAYTRESLFRTTSQAVQNVVDFYEGREPFQLLSMEDLL